MVGSEVLEERLVMCFTDFANEDWHKLTYYCMRRTLQLYKRNLEDKPKDSLRNLTSFLQHCETGEWIAAKSLHSSAWKEYEQYWKTKAQEPTTGRRDLSDGQHSNKEVQETELIRLDKPKIVGSEVLEERLVMCFTDFANKNWHTLTRHFMRRTLQVYEHHLENKRKDSLRTLTSFLQHCETGKWTPAKSLYSTALKEYEHYWKTKVRENTAGRRELSDGPHSNNELQEIQLMRLDKSKMAGNEVLEEWLGMCFTNFANENWDTDTLKRHFMRRTLQVYEHYLANKRKDSLRYLTSFLQHCETGKWTPAKLMYSIALKQYQHYWKPNVSPYPAHEPKAGRRELSDRPHSNNKEVPETELIRRSKDASILRKHNNPNISDLSDPNRPINLAERFSELYSNEYTVAFEELNGTNSNPAESIKCLLDIVKASYLFCMKQRKQMIDDQMKLTDSSMDDLGRRYEMMELGRTAEAALPNVRKEFMKSRERLMRKSTQRFAEKCVEIVWLMCIQQPPIHLEWVEKKQEKFNPDVYRSYTISGNFIEFCVWPVVYFHEKGPILTRGIAQGCD